MNDFISTKTTKGKPMLTLAGVMDTLDRKNGNSQGWRCRNRQFCGRIILD